MSKNADEITFKYIFDDDYNPKYINGAVGGITPRNEINMAFYQERQAIPKSVTHLISDSEGIGELTGINPDPVKIIRFIQGGITMDVDSAIRIHQWLGQMIDHVNKGGEDA